jgi:hypothetical protein
MIIREATLKDWDKLYDFFKKNYRANHPLHNKEFWEWQYGDEKFGRSFICLDDNEEVGLAYESLCKQGIRRQTHSVKTVCFGQTILSFGYYGCE